MGWMMTGMGIWSFVGGLLLVALLVLAGAGAVWLLRSAGARRLPPGSGHRDEATEILRRRYAAGEIDEDEFWRRMSGISAA